MAAICPSLSGSDTESTAETRKAEGARKAAHDARTARKADGDDEDARKAEDARRRADDARMMPPPKRRKEERPARRPSRERRASPPRWGIWRHMPRRSVQPRRQQQETPRRSEQPQWQQQETQSPQPDITECGVPVIMHVSRDIYKGAHYIRLANGSTYWVLATTQIKLQDRKQK